MKAKHLHYLHACKYVLIGIHIFLHLAMSVSMSVCNNIHNSTKHIYMYCSDNISNRGLNAVEMENMEVCISEMPWSEAIKEE